MTIVQSLEKITDWLQTNVCDKIKLKAPHDDDVKIYEEVNPVAHTLFQPGKSKAPPQTKYQIPSVVVQLIDGADAPAGRHKGIYAKRRRLEGCLELCRSCTSGNRKRRIF